MRVIALTALPLASADSALANADKPSQSLTVHLGPQRRAFEVTLQDDDRRPVAIHVGAHRLALRSWADHSPGGKPSTLTSAEDLELGSGDHIAVLHGADGQGHPQAIVVGLGDAGHPTILWQGDQSLHGDPGERTQRALRTEIDATGRALYAGLTYEQARLCGQDELPLLNPVRIAPKGANQPLIRQLTGAKLAYSVRTASQLAPSSLHLLAPQGTSNADRSLGPSPPIATVDGDLTTGWSSGEQDGGVGQFLSFTFEAHGLPMQGLAVRFAADSSPPQALRAYVQGGVLEIAVPTDISPERPWLIVRPQAPIATACLSLEIAAPAPVGGAVRVAEVQALSPFDGPDGPQALVAALEGEQATAASRVLAQSGPQVLPPLSQAWPTLGLPARQRAMPALLRHAAHPEVYPLLHEALTPAAGPTHASPPSASKLRELALHGLLARPESGIAFLRWQLAQRRNPDGELALGLATRAPGSLSETLLAGLSLTPADHSQTQLARAFARLAARHAEIMDALPGWIAQSPSPTAAAKLALALAQQGVPQAALEPLVIRALEADDGFEARYWAVQAAPLAAQRAEARTFLAAIAHDEPAWMLRDAALSGLAAIDTDGSKELLRGALEDPYPRVRARAVRTLGPTGQPLQRLLKHLTHDQWYLVRMAAAESLADHPQVRAALRSQIADPVRDVRVAVIHRLTALHDLAAWPAIQTRMALDSETLEVKLASADYAAALCVDAATASLQSWLDMGLTPEASETSRELAVTASGVLARLGKPDLVTTRLERVPETGLRTALQQALKGQQPCPR